MKSPVRTTILILIGVLAWGTTPLAYAGKALPPKPPSPPRKPGISSNDGVRGNVDLGPCHLYATSGPFGGSCLKPGTKSETVGAILKSTPDPTCWDVAVSVDDARELYGEPAPLPGTGYYERVCITSKIDRGLSPGGQKLQFSRRIRYMTIPAPECPQPYVPTDDTCLMKLTDIQKEVVDGFDTDRRSAIPDAILVTSPTLKIRTHVPITWVDKSTPVGSSNRRRTVDVTVGEYTMWAQMTASYIYPYGRDPGMLKIDCDVTAEAGEKGACVFPYPRSSHGQPNEAYPFVMETDWEVRFRPVGATGNGTLLAAPKKYNSLQIPVLDIQTIVVS